MLNYDHLNPRLLHASHIGQGNSPPPGDAFPDRVTRWHELDIITWGDGVDVVDGKSYPVRAGDIFYRVPGLRNQHFLPYHCYFFVFDPYYTPDHEADYDKDALDAYQLPTAPSFNPIPPFSFSTNPCLGKATDMEPLVSQAFSIFNEFHSKNPDQLYIKAKFLLLLRDLRDQLTRLPQTDTQRRQNEQYRQRILDVCEYIDSNPESCFKLVDLAKRTSLSPNFFCRLFHEITGETPIQRVNRVKINHVKLLLLDTELSVTEIAHRCGFNDATYLHTLFRKCENTTPVAYRKFRMRRSM